MTSTRPPAASIRLRAWELTACTLTTRGTVTSPWPKSLIRFTRLFTRPASCKSRFIHYRFRRKLVQVPEIDDGPGLPEYVGEAPFGNPPHQGHLAPFKPRPGAAAGAGVLPFKTSGRGLAPTGTGAAADPFLSMFGPRAGRKFRKAHLLFSFGDLPHLEEMLHLAHHPQNRRGFPVPHRFL